MLPPRAVDPSDGPTFHVASWPVDNRPTELPDHRRREGGNKKRKNGCERRRRNVLLCCLLLIEGATWRSPFSGNGGSLADEGQLGAHSARSSCASPGGIDRRFRTEKVRLDCTDTSGKVSRQSSDIRPGSVRVSTASSPIAPVGVRCPSPGRDAQKEEHNQDRTRRKRRRLLINPLSPERRFFL